MMVAAGAGLAKCLTYVIYLFFVEDNYLRGYFVGVGAMCRGR